MKIIYYIIGVFLFFACGEQRHHSSNKKEILQGNNTPLTVKTTPLKNQGASELCWAYAMLATIESEHLMMGDSVNLSPVFVARMFLTEQAEQYYLTGGRGEITTRGMGSTLLYLIQKYGIQPYDYYAGKEDVNFRVLTRKLKMTARTAIAQRTGLRVFRERMNELLDEELGVVPRQVHMLGAQYSSLEFAHSVCRKDEYIALTSFTHHPFGETFMLEVPDNFFRDEYMNVPIDTLMNHIVGAVRNGHPVYWEGGTHHQGFDFPKGIADLNIKETTQEERQRLFETFQTTDDHSMEIIGTGRNQKGKEYFICKNSWGKNAKGGYMLMSYDYVKMKTVAAIMTRDAWNGVNIRKNV